MATASDFLLQLLREDVDKSRKIANATHRRLSLVKRSIHIDDNEARERQLALRAVKGIHYDALLSQLSLLCPETDPESWLRGRLQAFEDTNRIENINAGLENIKPRYRLTLSSLQQLDEMEAQQQEEEEEGAKLTSKRKKFKVKKGTRSALGTAMNNTSTEEYAARKRKVHIKQANCKRKKQSDKVRQSKKSASVKRKSKQMKKLNKAAKKRV